MHVIGHPDDWVLNYATNRRAEKEGKKFVIDY